MALKRIVSTDFWKDGKVVDDFTPEDKYFMLYLLTNPRTTQLGIYEFNAKTAAFETGYSVESIMSLLQRFESKHRVIMRSQKTGEIAVINYLKHSIVKGGKPVEDLLTKEIAKIKDKSLIDFVFSKVHGCSGVNETVLKIIESYSENENENGNDNENDNGESYHDSYHDTPTIRHSQSESISYQEIQDLYNSICVSYPKCKALSEARKKAIKARLKAGYTAQDFEKLFAKAEASSFLKGKNTRNWSASFDWLISDANMAKVLDGNYDDKGKSNPNRMDDLDGLF